MEQKEKIICGIQQVGIGVTDVSESWRWYNKLLGFDLKVFDDEGVAELMLPYTGGKPQPRRAILALNPMGGGGLEIWQPKGREIRYPDDKVRLGDYGICACKLKTNNIEKAYETAQKNGIKLLSTITNSPFGQKHFFIKDKDNNVFEFESNNFVFIKAGLPSGGVNGVTIGVSDMDKSIEFYKNLLDYDIVVGDHTGIFDDMGGVCGANNKMRRVLLRRSKTVGPLCEVLGDSQIELIQNFDIEPRKIFANRYWGDIGYIHVCFDIRNMDILKKKAEETGHPFVCDSGDKFDMGEANGHFSYVEDPDGTLIEFVETHKIPIIKKLGISINLNNRDNTKPLPRFITQAFKFMRVSSDKI